MNREKDLILVVDDQAMNVDVLVGLLEGDYEVSVALSGEVALTLAASLSPDLILLDVRLPGMDGFEVCRRLKQTSSKDVGVLFLTSLSEDSDQARGLELGAIDFITKPFNPSLVRARIRNHLALVHASREISHQRDALSRHLVELQETQRRLIDSERQAVLGKMIAGMAHELNTPIGVAVTGVSYLIDRIPPDSEAAEMARLVLANLEKSHRLIQSLKQVSATAGGTVPASFDLIDLVRQLVAATGAPEQRSLWSFLLEGPDFLVIVGFPEILSRILEAMLLNTFDHAAPPGQGGLIKISLAQESEGIHIVYQDNGQGVATQELDHLFEPFRAPQDHKGGPGLGTFLIRHLVTAGLGGSIEADCQPGQGLRYTIVLPSPAKV